MVFYLMLNFTQSFLKFFKITRNKAKATIELFDGSFLYEVKRMF